MIVTTINREGLHSISLPQKVTGSYWLYDTADRSERLVAVEGINDEWVLKSNRKAKLMNIKGETMKNTILAPLTIYVIVKNTGEKTFVFTEPATEDRQIFTKYLVRDDAEFTIGRTPQNDICYDNKVVSARHATLLHRSGHWYLRDENSTNGTFVNEKRVQQTELFVGDAVYIMGLKIVVGKSFIAINNPDGKVALTNRLIKFVSQKVEQSDEEVDYELSEEEFFYRSPRFKRDVETATFKIDSPPSSPISEEMPWVLVIGSSLAMGMMSMITLINAILNNQITSIIMGGSMLIGTLLLPMITKRYERNRKRKKEALRQKKYREYLDRIAVQIDEECQKQEAILNENYITIAECEDRIKNVRRNLWERGMGQNDFLRVRVGHGDGLLDAELHYQERHFQIDDDNLQEELYSLCEKPKALHNIPITYSIFDDYISGAVGSRAQIIAFAKGLIIQLAALYSYDEVKFVFLYDESERREFDFVKWLPHVWSDDRKFRFIATNANEIKEVSAYLENVISERAQMNPSDMEDVSPYYVIFSLSKSLAIHAEMFKQIFSKKENIHFSVIALYDELRNLPKECTMVVELDGQRGRLFDKDDISGKSTEFVPDIYVNEDPLELSVRLANTPLDNLATNFKLPRMITFLELFGVGKVEHLNSLTRWKENDPTKSLEAAVGVDTLGETFMLDLHEKFHGPHGLVAGMTGSGKSEFIITYILSLAVNYHPNEVAFILIDYKGGGMAKSFEKLPHTAGIITNLDGGAIKRSLVSIESELKRRQAMFAEASKKIGVSNIDIYKYQKLYREGSVKEPLQHLFIISDEFAELKTQQPEFMTQLVSAARIGRSLGVHLILATQKPSGVVDDQIWSNSKFRVCLKVQERADSMDMLKRPDAAELTDTGRFYLQVGYNELFELGQSAWSGAPYYPSDTVQTEKDNSVVVIDTNGHPIKEAKIDRKRMQFANAKKQLDVITDYLRGIADDENIKIRALWLDPIPPVILLDDIRKKYFTVATPYVLNPVIGEYDDPAHQQQCVLRLPISEEGNVVVYGSAASGKTTFLNAMITSLIQEHTPDELNLYILDFASETLRAFAKAPHVGDVMLSYEAEKIGNLIKLLYKEAQTRKKLFADYGGDYSSYIKSSGKTLPSIVVVINNFTAFTETYEEKEDAISYLSREGTKYGIYFVLTSLGTNGVRFRLLQNFKQLITLQLNDESDYATVVGKTEGLFPSKYRGRGLVKRDELYEFQTASLTTGEIPFTYIQNMCAEMNKNWSGKQATRIPVLPENVTIDFLKEYYTPDMKLNVPIGVEKSSLNISKYPFGSSYINLVMSTGNDYREFTTGLIKFIAASTGYGGVVFDAQNAVKTDMGSFTLANNPKACEAEVAKLFELVLYRNNTYKTALENGEKCEAFEQYVVIIDSLGALKSTLGDEGNEKLGLILEKGTVEYGINVIIADQAKTVSSFSYEKWYKNKVSGSDGIWVGSGITEQYTMKPSKTTSDMHEDIGTEFGYVLQKGKGVRVKLLREGTEVDDNE